MHPLPQQARVVVLVLAFFIALLASLAGQERLPVDAPWNDGFQWWRPKGSNTVFVSVPKSDLLACAYNGDETIAECADGSTGIAVIQFPDSSLTHVRIFPSLRRLDIAPGEVG